MFFYYMIIYDVIIYTHFLLTVDYCIVIGIVRVKVLAGMLRIMLEDKHS